MEEHDNENPEIESDNPPQIEEKKLEAEKKLPLSIPSLLNLKAALEEASPQKAQSGMSTQRRSQ